MNQAIIIELLLSTLPYPSQIKNIDLDRKTCIELDWRGARYRVNLNLGVEERRGRLLHSTDTCMLIEDNLRKADALRRAQAEARKS